MEQDNNKLSSGLSELATLKKENEELKQRNRILVEALSGLMGRCIGRIRHSTEFKAAEKIIQSNK